MSPAKRQRILRLLFELFEELEAPDETAAPPLSTPSHAPEGPRVVKANELQIAMARGAIEGRERRRAGGARR